MGGSERKRARCTGSNRIQLVFQGLPAGFAWHAWSPVGPDVVPLFGSKTTKDTNGLKTGRRCSNGVMQGTQIPRRRVLAASSGRFGTACGKMVFLCPYSSTLFVRHVLLETTSMTSSCPAFFSRRLFLRSVSRSHAVNVRDLCGSAFGTNADEERGGSLGCK